MLDEVKHGLDWCLENLKEEENAAARAFLCEVMKQQQQQQECNSMQNWVQGGFGNEVKYNNVYTSTANMAKRYSVVSLLFGVKHVVQPMGTTEDMHVLRAALWSLRDAHTICPFSQHAPEVVQNIQNIDKQHFRNFRTDEELFHVWMSCESVYVDLFAMLMEGSVAAGDWPQDIIAWAVQEACDVVDHNLAADADCTTVLHVAIWALKQLFLQAASAGQWSEAVGTAARKVGAYCMDERFQGAKIAAQAVKEVAEVMELCVR